MNYSFYLKLNKSSEKFEENRFRNDLLNIDYSTLYPEPIIVDKKQKTIIVLGNIIFEDKFVSKEQINSVNIADIEENIILFNGQFALYYLDKLNGVLHVFTDHTASYPVFYFQENNSLTCSLSYSDIWKRDVNLSEIEKNVFYEFLVLRRIIGTKTYDKKSKYLSPDNHLIFDIKEKRLKISSYRNYDFAKFSFPFHEQAEQLAEIIKKAVLRRITDNKKYGLLLSGGIDSRVLLAVKKGVFSCLSIAYNENNEIQVARQVASLDGHHHSYIQRDA
ncbi:MAG: hypothetical protein K8R74_02430, partial [Bacteroidales bacterium]|nr:hypothetical protein [Bacteroidales bacterium]